MSIKQARQRVADLRAEMATIDKQLQAAGSGAITGKRGLTDGERAEVARLSARKAALIDEQTEADRALVAAEQNVERERHGESVADADAEVQSRALASGGIRPNLDTHTGPTGLARSLNGPRSYASLFGRPVASMDGWRDSAELFGTVARGMNDPRLRLMAHGGGSSDPHGGFAIPSALEVRIVDALLSPAGGSLFMRLANVQPMSVREQLVTTFDRSQDDEPGKMYGFKLNLHVEDDADDDDLQTTTLRQIAMRAATRGILFDVSNELLADAPSFETALLQAVTAAAGNGIDYACLTATGVGEPLGILNAGATIEVAKETGQGAATLIYANVTKMFSRMPAGAVSSAIWLANPSTIPQLLSMSQVVGTGGSHIPVLTSTNGNFELLTRPVVFTDLLPALGTAGDLMFVAPSEYTIGLRQGLGLAVSQDAGFKKNRTTFRLLIRFDGKTGWSSPYQPPYSAPTMSPFIKLGARA